MINVILYIITASHLETKTRMTNVIITEDMRGLKYTKYVSSQVCFKIYCLAGTLWPLAPVL